MVVVISETQYFRLHDGGVIKDLKELRMVLTTMEQSLYDYHVTAERNDFASWVRDVVGDSVLANNIQHAITPKEMISIIDAKVADDKQEAVRKNREKIRTAKFIFPTGQPRSHFLENLRRMFIHA
jgi:uncharacterized protein (UPF0218 family)